MNSGTEPIKNHPDYPQKIFDHFWGPPTRGVGALPAPGVPGVPTRGGCPPSPGVPGVLTGGGWCPPSPGVPGVPTGGGVVPSQAGTGIVAKGV